MKKNHQNTIFHIIHSYFNSFLTIISTIFFNNTPKFLCITSNIYKQVWLLLWSTFVWWPLIVFLNSSQPRDTSLISYMHSMIIREHILTNLWGQTFFPFSQINHFQNHYCKDFHPFQHPWLWQQGHTSSTCLLNWDLVFEIRQDNTYPNDSKILHFSIQI